MQFETGSSAALDVWNLAKDLQKKETQSASLEKTIIIVGQRSSGKTSFIKVLRSQNDLDVKPTCAIDYTFVRKMGVRKEVINCYEIASRNLRNVLGSLTNKGNFASLHFIVSIDMGQPADIIDSTLAWIQIIKEESQKALAKIDQEQVPQFFTKVSRQQDRMQRKYMEHQDSAAIQAVPIPTTLLINKYDLFEKYETEVRKWLARTVRYLAHVNGCSVFTNSVKSSSLSAQVRSIFSGFVSGETDFNQKDHLKPMFITFGSDTLYSMSLPHTGSVKMDDALRKQIQGLVGLKAEKKDQKFDMTKYREQKIDSIIAQKQKEFERISKKSKVGRSDNQLDAESPKRTYV